MSSTPWKTHPEDLGILRELARRQRDAAQDPIMEERRRLWRRHNACRGERPMILIETGGVRDEILPDSRLRCREPWARNLEQSFLMTLYQYETVRDDSVVDPYLRVGWFVNAGSYGVEVPVERGTDTHGRKLGFHWEPPLRDLERDFAKVQPRTFRVDREGTLAWKAHLEDVFDGILPVRIRGAFWWTMGMTWPAVNLIGLDRLMLFMYDQPEALHRLMAFLRDDHLAFAEWLEREGLLTLNNDNDYTGSGSRGFTTDLPRPGRPAGDPVHLDDLWVLLESQETVGVSPTMFAEFIFPYQTAVAERFGLCYYGCCEPVHNRWESVRRIPNLRSVSISPWCDEAFMAEALGRDYVYSRKPAPSLISTERFDEERIREDLRHTLRTARACSVELVMKDVHTVNFQPDRLRRWVELAREESEA